MKQNFTQKGVTHVITLPPPALPGHFTYKVLLLIILLFTAARAATQAQCIAPTLKFTNPVLINGNDGEIGAIYLFPKVIPGVDAQITIMDLKGASLAEIDNTTGAGYFDAFQPYVWAAANDTSYIDWKITFKQQGTPIDTTLACLAVTAIDVDGDNLSLKEFVEAATPGSFAVDPFTNLTISFDGVKSKAVGQITTIPLIDTNARQAMFQMNFTNINSLLYRNGAITTGISQIRQTCIYFAPFFFQNWITLPAKLQSFTAKEIPTGISLNWSATNEQDTKEYTIQKSDDAKNWREIGTVVAKNSTGVNKYSLLDNEKSSGVSYYRIRQTDIKGSNVFSPVIKSGSDNKTSLSITHNTIFTNRINLEISSQSASELMIEVYAINGQRMAIQKATLQTGNNKQSLQLPEQLSGNLFLLVVKNSQGQVIYKSKLVRG